MTGREHNLTYPYFMINFKIYPGTGGTDGLEFAKMIERVESETAANFVLSPQLPDIRMIASETDLTVTTPVVDAVDPGRGNGRVLPETISEACAAGAVINHPESRDTLSDVETKIERCRQADIDSIVCVDSVEMGRAVATFDPDSLIFEKPGDIATDRSIPETHPDRLRAFREAIDEVNPRTKVFVGGGISTAEDVRLAFEQGADATGAASAISLADDPEARLRSIAEVFE